MGEGESKSEESSKTQQVSRLKEADDGILVDGGRTVGGFNWAGATGILPQPQTGQSQNKSPNQD